MRYILIILLSLSVFAQVPFDPTTDNWLYNSRGSVMLFYQDDEFLAVQGDSLSGAIIISPLFFEIGKGSIPGYDSEFKFGQNISVGSTEEVIWDGGGNYTFLDYGSHERIKIVSTNDNDSLGGAGAWNLLLFGLDSNWVEQQEIILLSGIDTVMTSNYFLRIFRAIVINSGNPTPVSDANLGNINILAATTLIQQSLIRIGKGQTLNAFYTVPAGKTAYVTGLSFGVGQGKECTFLARIRNGLGGVFSVKYSLTLFESSFFGTLVIPLEVPEKIDMVVTASAATGTVRADASFGLILVDNQ